MVILKPWYFKIYILNYTSNNQQFKKIKCEKIIKYLTYTQRFLIIKHKNNSL